MKNRLKIILIAALFFSYYTNAQQFSVQNQDDCFTIADAIKKDTIQNNSNFQDNFTSISKRYRLVNKFSAGKGGAYVALVEDISNGEQKVLKIFPSIQTASNKYNYRELFYTCLNGFISYKDLGITMSGNNYNAFPRVYEVGMTNVAEYNGTEVSNFDYPYMIFEFIRGNSLTTLAQDALKNKNTSYRLYTKADLSNTSTTQINKRRTQAVIYQIVHIQYMLNRLLIKGKKYNFYHADLNTGNVMVRDVFVNASLNAGFGPIEAKNQPLVTFIDFGHSTSDFDSYLGANVNNLKTSYHKTLHIFSDSTAEFYKNLNGSSLNKATEFFSGLTAINSDMRLYLIMARAIYDSLNYTDEALMKHLKDCNTRTKCVEKAPPLFKAVK